MRPAVAVDVLEATYDTASDDASWLAQIAAAFEPLDELGIGPMVTVFDPDPSGWRIVCGHHAGPPEVTRAIRALEDGVPLELRRTMHATTYSRTASEYISTVGQPPAVMDELYRDVRKWGARDAFNVQGVDASGRALCVSVGLARHRSVDPRSRAVWNRVAVHFAASIRLRATLERLDGAAPLDAAEGIIDTRGRVVHARGAAKSAGRREALREAFRRIDEARGRATRQDAERALELWQGLFAGRWSLIDVFDSDGRRYVAAHRNDPLVSEDHALTRRERQVATLSAVGHSDAMVAYALGLSVRTVRTHLARALAKLRLKDRDQLTRLAATLLGDANDHAPARGMGNCATKIHPAGPRSPRRTNPS